MGGLLADFSQVVRHLSRILRPGTGLGADVGGGVDGLAVGFLRSVSPSRMRAVKVPEKESPAPTVSFTSTCGVSSVETSPLREMMVE